MSYINVTIGHLLLEDNLNHVNMMNCLVDVRNPHSILLLLLNGSVYKMVTVAEIKVVEVVSSALPMCLVPFLWMASN
jgi:hypothetical protein